MIQLRDFQADCLNALDHQFFTENIQNLLVVMATGLGKTEIIIKHVMDTIDIQNGKRVLIVVQTVELVYQMYNRFLLRYPELEKLYIGPYPAIGIEMAGHIDTDSRILVATRQTLAKDKCKRMFNVLEYGAFDLMVIDEADLSITVEYEEIHRALLNANNDMRCLGVTATSERSDGRALGIRFDKIAYEYDIRRGILEGWLKLVEPYAVNIRLPDLSTGSALSVVDWMDIHYDNWLKFDGPKRHTIHFLPDIEVAREYCRFLQERGVAAMHMDSMMCIDLEGKTHIDLGMNYWKHRNEIVYSAMQRGQAIYLTNKNILSRGVDWRYCNMIINSVTSHDSTFTQRVGRGTRLPQGVFQMVEVPSRNIWQVTWEDDHTTEEIPSDQLPFFPTTILLDFSGQPNTVQLMGTLFGDITPPVKKVKVETEEASEDGLSLGKPDLKKVAASDVVVEKTKLWRKMPVNWYQDVTNDCSTTFGNNVPYMLYISANQINLARKLYGELQHLKSKLTDDPEAHLRYNELLNFYSIISRWSIWIVEAEQTAWGSLTWNRFALCHMYYPDIHYGYSSLEFASHAAGVLTNYITTLAESRGYTVDYELFRRYRKSTMLPTDAQLKKLNSVKTSLINAGWKQPVIEPPQTLTEASQAINHFMAKASLIRYMRQIATGDIKIVL